MAYGSGAAVFTSAAAGASAPPEAEAGPALDTLVLGDSASERAHAVSASLSSTGTGALSRPFRRFNPPATAGFWGGSARFTMACSSTQTTYVTVKFWGSDVGDGNRLMLFCDGRQVGYYHLGDVDPLDIQTAEPRCANRFYYHTLPLPRSITNGRSTVPLEIRSSGRIYGYGSTVATYYRDMVAASRPVYRVYTHADPYLALTDEPQGSLPGTLPVRPSPGAEVMNTVRSRISQAVGNALAASPSTLDQNSMLLLAKAYGMSSTAAYNDPTALSQVVGAIDATYNAYLRDPAVMTNSNQQWQGFGKIGHVLVLVAARIGGQLAGNVTGAATTTNRRTAYTRMLLDSRDHWRRNRRQYTNQSMICDLGIYLANRGLAALGSAQAMPESAARQYVYQSMGISPWLGPEDAGGTPSRPLGGSFHLFSKAGLSRELGYVGYYGEIIDWACHLYEAVTTAGGPADATLRNQLLKLVKARAAFRYPDADEDGYRAMRIETVVGWRDSDYAGEAVYAQRSAFQGSPLQAPAVLKDATVTGYCRQMVEDNQLFKSIQDGILDFRSSLVDLTLLRIPDDYAVVQAQPAAGARLPMTAGQPDFVLADPECGVIAAKNGTDVLYLAPYWRARYGVNGLARVHLVTPSEQRSATIGQFSVHTSSGLTYTSPDWVNMAFGNGGLAPPGPALHQAYAGTTQSVAKAPADVAQPRAGTESPFSGRANFYNGGFGRYRYGMNTTANTTYTWVPAGSGTARDLVSGRTYTLGTSISVPPGATVLLYQ